jgi:hypothetical protein
MAREVITLTQLDLDMKLFEIDLVLLLVTVVITTLLSRPCAPWTVLSSMAPAIDALSHPPLAAIFCSSSNWSLYGAMIMMSCESHTLVQRRASMMASTQLHSAEFLVLLEAPVTSVEFVTSKK